MSLVGLQASEVVGIQSALRRIGSVDRGLRTQLSRKFRQSGEPLRQSALAFVPSSAPMSGWKTGRYKWDGARQGVRIKFSTKTDRSGSIRLLTLQQKNAAGAIYDIAGRASAGNTPQGQNMIRVLNERYGAASRSMWKGAEAALPEIEQLVSDAVDELAATVERLGL